MLNLQSSRNITAIADSREIDPVPERESGYLKARTGDPVCLQTLSGCVDLRT